MINDRSGGSLQTIENGPHLSIGVSRSGGCGLGLRRLAGTIIVSGSPGFEDARPDGYRDSASTSLLQDRLPDRRCQEVHRTVQIAEHPIIGNG